jgi:homoserine/homoserine lactone efflux protein
MSLEIYFAYVVACAVIALVPGPTVTLIVANSLAHGPRGCSTSPAPSSGLAS